MNDNLTKMKSKKPYSTLMIPGPQLKKTYSWNLNNMKLSQSQYSATYLIKYGPYSENMFVLEYFTHKFHQQ